jgi:hypothetical protein
MGYKRTVRCSHCYEQGHNKMGCPAYKEQIERQRADYGDDYYAVRHYDEKKARMANAKNNRSCSYCGEHGHSRAQCTKLKLAKELFRTKNVEYRENFLKVLVDNGIGPGALMKVQHPYRGEMVAMIKKIHWDKIHMAAKGADVIQFIAIKDIQHVSNESWHATTRLPANLTGDQRRVKWEIAVPTSSSAILDDCPKSFIGGKKVKGQLIAGKLGINDAFRDKDLGLYTMKDYWGDFDREFDADNYTTELGT